jgi:hypothetical protein
MKCVARYRCHIWECLRSGAAKRQTLHCLLAICNRSGLFAKRGLNQRIRFTPLGKIHFTSEQSLGGRCDEIQVSS